MSRIDSYLYYPSQSPAVRYIVVSLPLTSRRECPALNCAMSLNPPPQGNHPANSIAPLRAALVACCTVHHPSIGYAPPPAAAAGGGWPTPREQSAVRAVC